MQEGALLSNWFLVVNLLGASLVVLDIAVPKSWVARGLRKALGLRAQNPLSSILRTVVAASLLSVVSWAILVGSVLEGSQEPILTRSLGFLVAGALTGGGVAVGVSWVVVEAWQPASPKGGHSVGMACRRCRIGSGPCFVSNLAAWHERLWCFLCSRGGTKCPLLWNRIRNDSNKLVSLVSSGLLGCQIRRGPAANRRCL